LSALLQIPRWLLPCALLVACSATKPEGRLACDADSDCPSEFRCLLNASGQKRCYDHEAPSGGRSGRAGSAGAGGRRVPDGAGAGGASGAAGAAGLGGVGGTEAGTGEVDAGPDAGTPPCTVETCGPMRVYSGFSDAAGPTRNSAIRVAEQGFEASSTCGDVHGTRVCVIARLRP
jgi:hypothetical protein